MKVKLLLQVLGLMLLSVTTAHAQFPVQCIDYATVSLIGGDTSIVTCEGDGLEEFYDFRTSTLAMPFAYLITDQNNIILRVSIDNTLSFEGLGEGNLRVWAFAWLGQVIAEPGQDATTAPLATICSALTTNFVPVINTVPVGGMVTTAAGEEAVLVCPDDGVSDEISFTTTGDQTASYTFIVTDEDNVIVAIVSGDTYDFDQLPEGDYRVWGVSHAGAFTAEVGDDAAATPLAESCFDLSENFVTISRAQPDGGTVSLEGGTTEATVCINDGQPDELGFTNSTTASATYVYLITDENNVVAEIVSADAFDFENAAPGLSRVWGLSYTGQLTVAAGDDAAAVALSDGCFDLSDNFITVTTQEADGGEVRLADGGDETFACAGDGEADVISFVNTSAGADNYTYLITDEENIILDFAPDGSFDFEDTEAGLYRIWGLAYAGDLLAETGDDAAAAVLADGCFGLSDNFITVRSESVEGGMVTATTGEDPVFTCPGDDVADEVVFENNGSSSAAYTYVITDEDLILQTVVSGDAFDFDSAPEGTYLVWGLAYSGNLTAEQGDDASAVALSDECFDLSDNFVTVVVATPEGGMVASEAGETTVYTCPDDGNADVISFDSSGTSAGAYTYVVTDEDNNILALPAGDSFDFENAPAGICRVWGLAYTGDITAGVGDNAAAVNLSDDCFDLSDNFITVVREQPEGGTVAMPDGETTTFTCPGDGMADIVMFDSSGTSSGLYVYVITDDQNNILALASGDSFDFDSAPAGTCRVWGLAYTGNIIAEAGDNAAAVALTDDCFDLSDNFITVIREAPEGGTLTFEDGTNLKYACPGDDLPNVFAFDSSGVAGPNFTYVITDEQNIILDLPAGDSYDFDTDSSGIVRVWGLAYTGSITASVGDTASVAMLTDDCFSLSDNFLVVVREQPLVGDVETEEGETTVFTCPGDGNPDIIRFDSLFASITPFTYVITDEDNVILALPADDSFDFDGAPAGNCRVWGLAYTGNITAMIGDTASAVAITDECWDLSDNFITVVREVPEGGTVATPDGETTVYTCPGDGNPDIVTADSSDTSAGAYTYVITDENNIILDLPGGDTFDFEDAPAGNCRIWGLAYTGEISAALGDDAAAVALSDDCFDLSDNFITVVREQPEGGTVATAEGEETVTLCPGDGNADLIDFDSSGTAGNYAYVITNESNIILTIAPGDVVDFDQAGIGVSRVWGLAYTGNITANAGDDAAAVALSDDCFDLSDNFVTVIREVPNGGIVRAEGGAVEVYTCPGDGNPDIVSVDSAGTTGNYAYVITDENNVILELPDGDTFDFDGAPAGNCRIWGLAYAGNITAEVGDTASVATLADDCFALSSNFVTVFREQPEGGSVSTEAGDTELLLCPSGNLSEMVRFDSAGTAGLYAYVVTDEDNVIVDLVPDGDMYDFASLPTGVNRIWGLAYTGNVTATVGDDADIVPLTDDCFDLSDNFVTITRAEPDAGSIGTAAGPITLEVCVGDGVPDSIFFEVTGATSNPYLFLVTNGEDFLVSSIEDNFLDFENIVPDTYRVYGLSYTGQPNALPGVNIFTGDLSSDCYDLTDQFIEINAVGVDGGVIFTDAGVGVDELNLCAGDGIDDIVSFSTTSSANEANYTYAITNEDGIVIGFVPGDELNFEVAGTGVALIRGISYTGTLTLNIGDNINTAEISDGCAALSDNIITIVRDFPEGGQVRTDAGETEVTLCVSPDGGIVNFENTSGSINPYVYLLTTEDNIVIDILTSDSFDFSPLPEGTYRVWGLSYTGVLEDIIGEDASDVFLATSCFQLSADFITVTRAASVDGGMVMAFSAGDTVYTCASDQLPDPILLENTSTADAEYRYIITNASNNVRIADVEGNVIDFNGAAPGVYHIWGVSYVGNLILGFNDLVPEEAASDSCFQYSANFITVVHTDPEGGSVFTEDGADAVTVTVGDGEADEVTFINAGASNTPYLYVVTDTDNVILDVLSGDTKDFEDSGTGICRVWGLAYTGNLLAEVGDTASTALLTDACWDLSDGFVTVTREEALVGGELEDRSTVPEVAEPAQAAIADLRVAPNPAIDLLTVQFELQQPQQSYSEVRVLNSQGQQITAQRIGAQAGNNRFELNVNGWTAGMYVVVLSNGKEVQTVRFLVAR